MLLCIGGPPRSGTELMRQVLNGLEAVHLAPETHVFGDLLAQLRCRPDTLLEAPALAVAVNYFRALSGAAYGNHGDLAGARLAAGELEAMAAAPTVAALYEAYCRWSARRHDVPALRFWGDKTPRHIFAIDTIMAHFPDARLVAMVRDPRAVLVSYRDWRNHWFDGQAIDPVLKAKVAAEERRARLSYHPFIIALLWRAAAQAAHAGSQRYPDRVRVVRFEDLVTQPEREVAGLCQWLGVPFQPRALAVSHLNSSFRGQGHQAGFQPGSMHRWQTRLTGTEQAVITRLAGPVARQYGYATGAARPHVAEAVRMLASFVPMVAMAAWVNRNRRGSLWRFLLERLRHLQPG